MLTRARTVLSIPATAKWREMNASAEGGGTTETDPAGSTLLGGGFVAASDKLRSVIPARPRKHRAFTSFWTAMREAFWIAIEALRGHKLRSFLTLLGLVIATTTLIVVISIIHGMNLYIADHIANLGANVFIVDQFNWTNSEEQWLKERRRNKPLRIEDYEFLKDHLPDDKNIGAVAGRWPRPDIRYRGQILYDMSFHGLTPSMMEMGQETVKFGRFITESDYAHSAMVCFIGQDIVDKFFTGVDPLDKVIEIGGQPFRVIGVASKIGTTFGRSGDDFVQIPLTTFAKYFAARPRVEIHVQAQSAAQMIGLEDEARALMRARHHLP